MTNSNFIAIDTVRLEMTAQLNQQSVATVTNHSRVSVPLRSTREVYVDMNITLTDIAMYYIMFVCSLLSLPPSISPSLYIIEYPS